MKRLSFLLSKYDIVLVLIFLFFLSINVSVYFYQSGDHLLYGDAISRLNISRKIVDNLNPGFAQLGNVWLPVPQLLMLIFTWNSYLWHSGLAGTFVSSFAFIAGGFFIYKTISFITNSRGGSLFGLLVYATNINLLYFQTTAMSETLFICLAAMCTYGLVAWTYTKKHSYLILAAFGITLMTLTRYEGLAILGTSMILVALYSYFSSKNRSKAEGDVIMFSTLACLGFILWTIYLTAIFGNPFYWKSYYADTRTTTEAFEVVSKNVGSVQAFLKYLTSVIWMNGVIPFILAALGVIFVVFKAMREKSLNLIPLVLPFAVITFMVLTLQINTPIEQPQLTLENISSNSTSNIKEFNIRYGILLLPWVAIFCGYLFGIKNIFLKSILIALLIFNITSYFTNQNSLTYQLRVNISETDMHGTFGQKSMVNWLRNNHDSGLIMISALKEDPQMFQLGFDYKTYIHEGSGKYWKTSIKNPQRYAKWIVMDVTNKEDQVTKYLKSSSKLNKYYDLAYKKEEMRVYKIKTKPEVEITK